MRQCWRSENESRRVVEVAQLWSCIRCKNSLCGRMFCSCFPSDPWQATKPLTVGLHGIGSNLSQNDFQASFTLVDEWLNRILYGLLNGAFPFQTCEAGLQDLFYGIFIARIGLFAQFIGQLSTTVPAQLQLQSPPPISNSVATCRSSQTLFHLVFLLGSNSYSIYIYTVSVRCSLASMLAPENGSQDFDQFLADQYGDDESLSQIQFTQLHTMICHVHTKTISLRFHTNPLQAFDTAHFANHI